MANLINIVTMSYDEDILDEALRLLMINARAAREEEGCLQFDVVRQQGTKTEFILYEVYKDEAALDTHKTYDHFNIYFDFIMSRGDKVRRKAVLYDQYEGE